MIDLLQMVVVLGVLLVMAIPLGGYMAAVFTNRQTFADRVFNPIDNAIYALGGVDKNEQQAWRRYVTAMLLTNFVMFLLLFTIYLVQSLLPLNPDGMKGIDPMLAFNTAASFITNTNWQNYGGESTLTYFTQMFAIIFPMFTSAATGLVCGVAFIQGLGGSPTMGNFYVDLTRACTRLLIPGALLFGVLFVGLGVPSTFDGAVTATTLNGPLTPAAPAPVTPASPADGETVSPTGPSSLSILGICLQGCQESSPAGDTTPTAQGQQNIARGLVAPLASIKHFGTNGGGWFNTNSAHPFENPTPLTNTIELWLMGSIPVALLVMLGVMLKRNKQALTLFAVMAGFFLVFLAVDYVAETAGNPLLTAQGLNAAQGNMEGKEVRFGQAQTALFTTATTAFATGTVDSMHDSMTPLGSITPLAQMMLNMVFGGKGVGFINLIIFAILGIFLTGLMVGRTPEFLGKKIESHEVKLAAVAFLMHPMLILGAMATSLGLSLDLTSFLNPGAHGFSELLYMYTSQSANNGSAFAGFTGNTAWYNFSGGIVMLLGRYAPIVLMLALAGSLAAKKPSPVTVGTMRTDSVLFGGVLAGTVLVIGALTFYPVLAIGPIAEHLAMVAGKAF